MIDIDEQRASFADSVEKLFLDIMSRARPSDADEEIAREQLWQTMEINGVTAIFDPESEGGLGGGWEDAFPVLMCTGLHTVRLPIAETLVARRLLIGAGMPLPNGPIALGWTQRALELTRSPGGAWRLNATLPGVAWGNAVRHVLVAVDREAGGQLILVDSLAIRPTHIRENMAGEPVADLQFEDIDVVAIGTAHENPFERAALARTVTMAGALSAALHLSVQHANDRRQFGRPIGKFQAIQHSLALLANETAAVNCAALAACRAASRGNAQFEIAAAKLRANRAVGIATSIAHQVHGAIGFTREHTLHLATQRLWSWRSEYGNDRYWAAMLGKRVAALGARNLWSHLAALSDG
jgi:acyl-CoA dehydrogenase